MSIDTGIYIFLYFFFIIFSFFFSGTETGYMSLNRLKYENDLKKGLRNSSKIKRYVYDMNYVLVLSLLGNNLVNLAMTNVSILWVRSLKIDENYLYRVEFTMTVLTTILLFTFGEVIPKLIFKTYANIIVDRTYRILRFFEVLFKPMIFIFYLFSKMVSFFFFWREKKDTFSKKDFTRIVDDSYTDGFVKEEEAYLLSIFLSISKTKVMEVMTPLVDMYLIEKSEKIEDIFKHRKKWKGDFLFVYEKRIDNIIGYIYIHDLIEERQKRKSFRIKDILSTTDYIANFMVLDGVYEQFSNTDKKVFIVVDEYGGCDGVVSQTDVVECLFGLKYKEVKKTKKQWITQIDTYTYEVDSLFDIDDFNRIFNIEIPKKGFETIAGFIYYLFGYIPKKNYVAKWNGISFRILEATPKSVDQVLIYFSKDKYFFEEKKKIDFFQENGEKKSIQNS